MKKRNTLYFLPVLLLGLASGPAQAKGAKALEKPVKTLISAVRYDKDALALKFLAGDPQGEYLLGDTWNEATPQQRAEFVKLFHGLFSAIAFPKIRENFEHLSTILYDAPKMDGDHATLGSTLVILHPLKKQELKVRYDLVKAKSGWKVLDVTVLGTGGKSMLTEIRDDQVKPILAEGGIDHLLSLMKERLAQVKAAK